LTEEIEMPQSKEVNVNWLRINVPSIAAIVTATVVISMYVQSLSARVATVEENNKSRSTLVDKNFDQIKDQLNPLLNLPFRVGSVEQNLITTNQRMDSYLQTLGVKIDGISDRVNGLTTKVEVLAQKIDSITPDKRADTGLNFK
jgi:outer membrane murein-binding lipoprotein Lpp